MRKSSFRLAFDCCATSNHSLVREHWPDLQDLYRLRGRLGSAVWGRANREVSVAKVAPFVLHVV
jgi:hypothetical protein